MLDQLFSNPRTRARIGRSWLAGPIDDFLQHLAAQRFNSSTLRLCSYRLLAFGEFAARQGVGDIHSLSQCVEPFLAQVHAQDAHRRVLRRTLARFLRHLQGQQGAPAPEPLSPPSPHVALVDEYVRSRAERRGLCRNSLDCIRLPCRALLAFATAEGLSDLHSLAPDVIHRFIVDQGKQCCRSTVRSRCAVLRGFLSHLYRQGVVAADLAVAVVAPRVYQQEQCPRFLTRAEIDAVLAAIDRQTPAGRRDYAMVSLLAVYGLRGIEVIHLRLDDLDWRRQLLHIRGRKAGNNTTYPLSTPVGEAILAYLRDGRPPGAHREIFLTTRAPFTPLVSSTSLGNQVKHYLAKARVCVERPGTHSFRYSCAQRLFTEGVPLKMIGDYLGHRDLGTTRRYTKIALEQLREVAAGDGEDLL
jgi:integrase/recombinase XerD